MDLKALTTTIVSGVLSLALLVCTTVLLVSNVDVPSEFIPAFLITMGLATGASTKASG